ncbi:MAG: hypothetical protein AB8B94_02160 [Hyphomicrobiales bacterium]
MTALSLSRFSFPNLTFRNAEPKVDDTAPLGDFERRQVVRDMITAGACGSEHGAQMLMSVFPHEF